MIRKIRLEYSTRGAGEPVEKIGEERLERTLKRRELILITATPLELIDKRKRPRIINLRQMDCFTLDGGRQDSWEDL